MLLVAMLGPSRVIYLAPSYHPQRCTSLFIRTHSVGFPWRRRLSTLPTATLTSTSPTSEPPPLTASGLVYHGPISKTFRHLKIFSLSSLTLSFTMAPFMFLVESNLNMSARFALAATALATSGVSTGLVAWCGKPYVTTLRRRTAANTSDASSPVEEIELTTLTLGLHPRITRVSIHYFFLFFSSGENSASDLLLGNCRCTTPNS